MTTLQIKSKADLLKLMSDAFQEATGLNFDQAKEMQATLRIAGERLDKMEVRDALDANRRDAVDAAESDAYKRFCEADPHKGAGLEYARFLRAHCVSKLDGGEVREILKEWGSDVLAQRIEAHCERSDQDVQRALGVSTQSIGGALLPDTVNAEIIAVLRAQNVMRQAGATVLPMPNGRLRMKRQTGTETATYESESASNAATQPSFGRDGLDGRRLQSTVPVSNDLLRLSDPTVDAFLRNSMVATMNNRMDIAMLRGDGTQSTPRGIRYQAATANQFTRTGTTFASIIQDMMTLQTNVYGANVPFARPAYFFPVRTRGRLMTMRDAAGWIFREEMSNGQIYGAPYFVANQTPTNLGGAGDETEVTFADMAQVVIGIAYENTIDVFPGGAYDTGSAVVSGISRDETVLRIVNQHDIMLRHAQAASVVDGVDWYGVTS